LDSALDPPVDFVCPRNAGCLSAQLIQLPSIGPNDHTICHSLIPQKSAVLTSPERKSASGCSSRTRGELSLQNARKSRSESLRSDRTSIAPGRACSGLRKRHFCKIDKSTKNCAYASASPDRPTPSTPLRESGISLRRSLAKLCTPECSIANTGTALRLPRAWWYPFRKLLGYAQLRESDER
jgi:hypothetical protein